MEPTPDQTGPTPKQVEATATPALAQPEVKDADKNYKWRVLFSVIFGTFMFILDSTADREQLEGPKYVAWKAGHPACSRLATARDTCRSRTKRGIRAGRWSDYGSSIPLELHAEH